MAYVSQEMKAKLAPTIKAICKKYGVKASLAVRNHSSLVLNIKSGKLDFLNNFGNDRIHSKTHLSVNTYWFHEHFSGNCKKFLEEVIPAMKGPDFFDHSDAMTDYFHCSHYIDINVGQWDKPYILEA